MNVLEEFDVGEDQNNDIIFPLYHHEDIDVTGLKRMGRQLGSIGDEFYTKRIIQRRLEKLAKTVMVAGISYILFRCFR